MNIKIFYTYSFLSSPGEAPGESNDPEHEQQIMAKTEISLTLNNKFEIHAEGDEDTKKIFLKWV